MEYCLTRCPQSVALCAPLRRIDVLRVRQEGLKTARRGPTGRSSSAQGNALGNRIVPIIHAMCAVHAFRCGLKGRAVGVRGEIARAVDSAPRGGAWRRLLLSTTQPVGLG